MWPLGALLALLTLATGVSNQACQGKPERCFCHENSDIVLTCERVQGQGSIRLEGKRTQYVKIYCNKEKEEDTSTNNLTCEDIPEFDFGHNSTLDAVSFHGCPLSSLMSIACVPRRLQARAVLNLTVLELPNGPQLLPKNFEGLDGVQRLTLSSEDKTVTIPRGVLERLPTTLEGLKLESVLVELTPGAFRGLSALKFLKISSAGLRKLPDGAIADLPALTELSLCANEIENITSDALRNLTSLEKLDVSSNRLSALNGTALAAGCPSLREIEAYDNPLLTMLPLTPLKLLEKLEINECSGENSLELTSRALGGLLHLTHVTLRSCNISKLPEDLLTGSRSLRCLNLTNNSLRELPVNLFADQRALQELVLSKNKLETLPQKLFLNLKGLERLNLDVNYLVELPDYFAESLQSLRALSVAHNHLWRLNLTTLAGAGALEHLDLSYNQLENTPARAQGQNAADSPFYELRRLRTINLSHNNLSAMYSDWPVLSSLSLDMSNNSIRNLTDQDISLIFLSSNKTVDLRDNKISLVALLDKKKSPDNNMSFLELRELFAPRQVDLPENTSRVLLAGNLLDCDCQIDELVRRGRGLAFPAMDVSDAECADPPALHGRRFADIDIYDLICELPSNFCVPNCHCMRRSSINSMDCTASFDSLPQHLENLLELKLRFTPPSFSWIPSTVQALSLTNLNMTEVPTDLNFSAIKYLDLSRNSLTKVPVDILKANITLKLSRNPLACDCWQLHAYRNLVKDYEEVTCVDGFSVWRFVSVVLALLGLAFIVATAFYQRYSLHLKVFLYSRGWCGCWVREKDLDKDKKFDAFITYSEKDKNFVHDILQPGLEDGPQRFKLCIHHRDWIVGEWIPAQIAESVEQSRRTIVVLSKNFLDSKWSRLEFRTANMSAVMEKHSRVIVILLEDVANHKGLDAELRAYLDTNTYLKWGDPWFWKKLRYALRHRVEKACMRKQGGRLAHPMQGSRRDKCESSDFPLGVKFAPNGMIPNAAIKTSPDQKLSSAEKALPM